MTHIAIGCTPRFFPPGSATRRPFRRFERRSNTIPSRAPSAEAESDLYMARDFQGAVDQAWRTLAMEPRFAPAQHALGLAYQQMGMLEEAMVEFQNALVCSANHTAAAAALAHAYATAGQRREA